MIEDLEMGKFSFWQCNHKGVNELEATGERRGVTMETEVGKCGAASCGIMPAGSQGRQGADSPLEPGNGEDEE